MYLVTGVTLPERSTVASKSFMILQNTTSLLPGDYYTPANLISHGGYTGFTVVIIAHGSGPLCSAPFQFHVDLLTSVNESQKAATCSTCSRTSLAYRQLIESSWFSSIVDEVFNWETFTNK